MKTPYVFSADEIKTWSVQSKVADGLWTLARPMSHSGINLVRRITAAWMVFTGQADVLVWSGVEE